MSNFAVFGLLGILCVAVQASAADIKLFDGELSHPSASSNELTVIIDSQPHTLKLDEIETLPLYATTLTTPFGESGQFIGVLLTDLLDHVDPGDIGRVRLLALDDYAVILTREQIQTKMPFLATRLHGEPLTLLNKGPFRLLFPTLAEQTVAGNLPTANWIWSLIEIRRIK